MRTLAVVNQKGGVGKTTLAVHLGYAAVEAGLRVLLVDLDTQSSLSLSFPTIDGAEPGLLASSLYSADGVTHQEPEILGEKLAIIRADDKLALLNGSVEGVAKRPARSLRRFADQYDLCLIDTPGGLGFNPPMTVSALVAADAVVCPVSIGLYEGKALADLWTYLKQIKTPAYNPTLRLMGLLPSKVNTKSPEERHALENLRAKMGPVILPGMLAERTAVKQAIMRRRPVWKNTRGAGHLSAAKEWRAVCNHILGMLGEVKK